MREGGHHTAGDVAKDLRFPENRLARQTAADVTVNRIGDVRARAVRDKTHSRHVDLRFAQVGSGVPGGITQFGGHDDLGQLLPDMGGLMDVVHLGSQGRGPQQDIADSRLAA